MRALTLLREQGVTDAGRGRCGRPPPAAPVDDPEWQALVAPPFSPHAFIETDKGTIEIELAVLDAPLTVANFITLARKGFFNGLAIHRVVPDFVVQDGDPRGDGEGGPGYTIRDEINQRPYLRGTVGMALDWKDTGGSQFFITHSPQPHLDARYTVFGHVVSGHGGRRSDRAVGCGAARADLGRREPGIDRDERANSQSPRLTASDWELELNAALPLLRRLLLSALCFLRHLNPPFHPWCGLRECHAARPGALCRLARRPGCRRPRFVRADSRVARDSGEQQLVSR